MTTFNRIVAIVLWLVLLSIVCLFAITPLAFLAQIQAGIASLVKSLESWRAQDAANFVIGQSAFVVAAVQSLVCCFG